MTCSLGLFTKQKNGTAKTPVQVEKASGKKCKCTMLCRRLVRVSNAYEVLLYIFIALLRRVLVDSQLR